MDQIMVADREQVERRSVSMYPQDWQVVDALARERRIGVSAVLRQIIQEWNGDDARLVALARAFFRQQLTAEEFAQEVGLAILRGGQGPGNHGGIAPTGSGRTERRE